MDNRSFNLNLTRFAEQVLPEQVVTLHRFVSLDLLRRVVLKSPVDSGRYRGAWSVSLTVPDAQPLSASAADRVSPIGPEQIISNAITELQALQPYSIIWLSNRMPYALRIENGWSGQAPAGVLAVSIAEVEAGFASGGSA